MLRNIDRKFTIVLLWYTLCNVHKLHSSGKTHSYYSVLEIGFHLANLSPFSTSQASEASPLYVPLLLAWPLGILLTESSKYITLAGTTRPMSIPLGHNKWNSQLIFTQHLGKPLNGILCIPQGIIEYSTGFCHNRVARSGIKLLLWAVFIG